MTTKPYRLTKTGDRYEITVGDTKVGYVYRSLGRIRGWQWSARTADGGVTKAAGRTRDIAVEQLLSRI